MDFNEYQTLTNRTAQAFLKETRIDNYVYGINGEVGELTDYLKKVKFHGHKMSQEHITKELGDILWYVARLAADLGIRLDDVAITNIEKLKKRYPQGFSVERSVNRNDKG